MMWGMRLKRAEALLRVFSLAVLLIAVLGRSSVLSSVLTLLCVAASLVVLYVNLPKLSNVSEDSPKVKTLKSVTVFSVVFLLVVMLLVFAGRELEKRGALDALLDRLSEGQLNILTKAGMALLLAVPVLFFGNIAPKIPFNRYTGLRLPWTVRDEETWIVAHRVLGYLSFPVAVLVFVHVPTDMPLETYVERWWLVALLLWIGIPALISGIFYYKKWTGRRA